MIAMLSMGPAPTSQTNTVATKQMMRYSLASLYKGTIEEGRSYVYPGTTEPERARSYEGVQAVENHSLTTSEPVPVPVWSGSGLVVPRPIAPPPHLSLPWWATDWTMIIAIIMIISSLGYLLVLWRKELIHYFKR